ncbi:unnamed protein product, partial [Phaeothamnion confervicola]
MAELIDPWEALLTWAYAEDDNEDDGSVYCIVVYRERCPKECSAPAQKSKKATKAKTTAAISSKTAPASAAAGAALGSSRPAGDGAMLKSRLAIAVATRGGGSIGKSRMIANSRGRKSPPAHLSPLTAAAGAAAAATESEDPETDAEANIDGESTAAAGSEAAAAASAATTAAGIGDAASFEPGAVCVRAVGCGGRRAPLRQAVSAFIGAA